MDTKIFKLYLRLAISIGFLSAVADRFGLWPKEISAWGNWESFLEYTQLLNPLIPASAIPALGIIATAAEILFGICLIIGFKTETIAKASGLLILLFGLAMSFSTGVKGALDYSVFAASAAAFALSAIKDKYLELDMFISKNN